MMSVVVMVVVTVVPIAAIAAVPTSEADPHSVAVMMIVSSKATNDRHSLSTLIKICYRALKGQYERPRQDAGNEKCLSVPSCHYSVGKAFRRNQTSP